MCKEMETLWYGVYHLDRTITVHPYDSWTSYKKAGDAPLTVWTTRIFEAPDKEAAQATAHGMICHQFNR